MNNYNLRILCVEDFKPKNLEWYKNNKVTRFSDNQYRSFSSNGQINYIRNCIRNSNLDLYGIFCDKKYIGNITISGFLSVHKRAEISYLVGDLEFWGRGAATFAVRRICQLGKSLYKLNKIYAGLADSNTGSKKVLESNNFKLEGIRKKHLFYNDKWYDQLDYGKILV